MTSVVRLEESPKALPEFFELFSFRGELFVLRFLDFEEVVVMVDFRFTGFTEVEFGTLEALVPESSDRIDVAGSACNALVDNVRSHRDDRFLTLENAFLNAREQMVDPLVN